MRDQEIIGLWEAYQQVYAQPEEVEQLDEITASMGRRAKKYRQDQAQAAHMAAVQQHQEKMENDPEYRAKHEASRTVHSRRANGGDGEDQKESVDLFDYLLEYLVAEGYADTNKSALVIMANMSEEWKQSIIEGVGGYDDPILGPHTSGGKLVRGGVEAAKKVVTGVVKGVGSEFAKPAPQPPGGLTPMQRLQRRPDPTIR